MALLWCGFSANTFAQTNLFSEVRKSLTAQYPEVDVDDHLIAFSVWQVNDAESRALNKQLEKTFSVYRQALLKGGKKGLLVVLYNADDLTANAVIALQKDGVGQCYSLPLNSIDNNLLRKMDSGLYDASGALLLTDLKTETVYSFIQGLITR